MVVPWLAVGKLVLANLDTIIGVVKPAFTRKKVDAIPTQSDLLNQQIAELQAASSSNAEQIRDLAAQLKQVVTALDQAAVNAAAERERTRKRSASPVASKRSRLRSRQNFCWAKRSLRSASSAGPSRPAGPSSATRSAKRSAAGSE